MMKRGNSKAQVTLFIIIAIVIVAVAALVIVLWPKISSLAMSKQQVQSYLSTQATQLRDSIATCVEETSSPAFTKMGLQAGYYDTTGLRTLNFAGNDYIVVMYKDAAKQRINKLPSLSQIEEQYQIFLTKEGNAAIDKCLNNLAGFRRNMNIEEGTRKITASIYPESVIINVDWPMKLSKASVGGTVEQSINQRSAMLLVPLGYMWQTANTVTDCETQIDCRYEGIEWDKDNWNNPFRLQYITKDARSINKDQIVFILESVPYRPGELPYKFNFGIDRS